jgi:hypothetical protein
VAKSSITESVSAIPQEICFKIFETDGCDRIFVLENRNSKTVEGTIMSLQDTTNKNTYRFSLSGMTLNPNEIIDIEWLLDKQNVICGSSDEVCIYNFPTYGRKMIQAIVTTTNEEKYTFETEVIVNEPLSIVRRLKVLDIDGNLVNDGSTYDTSLKAFVLKNAIIPPDTLTFDTRDVVSSNP